PVWRCARKLVSLESSSQIATAENRNENELIANAHAYPSLAALHPANTVPAVSVAHCVVCVSEFAVCNSCGLAIAGRIAARPLVKNGDANISAPLSTYSSHGRGWWIVAMNASATTARMRSLAIMIC